jgi:hypothetical protein
VALPRQCSECENFLPADSSKTRKTCSAPCRQKRSRRITRQRKTAGAKGHDATRIPQEWKDVLEDAGTEVVKEELRPVVREAMTEDSMQALQRMVRLLPGVVDQLAKDITHPDDLVRQKAHTMILRYTLGHEKALPPDDKQPAGVNVILAMPRPDTSESLSDTAPQEPVSADAEELRLCDTCSESKPTSEFFGAALRCDACVTAFQERAQRLLEPPAPATGEESA